MSTYGCKKKSKFLRKKNNKPSILPFFTITAPVASAQAQASKLVAPAAPKQEAPVVAKKTTIINAMQSITKNPVKIILRIPI